MSSHLHVTTDPSGDFRTQDTNGDKAPNREDAELLGVVLPQIYNFLFKR